MADLAGALDTALRARYPQTADIRRPVTHRQGLTARMNALEKLFTVKGDRKGAAARRAAEAAGIKLRTWQKWRKGDAKPNASNARKLEGAYVRKVQLPRFRRRVNSQAAPNRVTVTAIIRWSSSPGKNYNRTRQRTTTLDGMRGVMVRVIRAWATAGPAAAAQVFETGAAEVYRTDEIAFEGDHVIVEFP